MQEGQYERQHASQHGRSAMVHLTRIYTRTGDGGETRLADLSLTSKTDPRVEAYGDVDEANSLIGVALAIGDPGVGNLGADVRATLGRVQNELFDCGADLSTPLARNPKYPPLRITADYITRLEADCDGYGDPLPALHSFILPGGRPPPRSSTWRGPSSDGPNERAGRPWRRTAPNPSRGTRPAG